MYTALAILPLIFLIFFSSLTLLKKYTLWKLDLPQSEYRVLSQKNIRIPMDDGVHLALDVYRPISEKQFPVIIMRTPYGKSNSEHQYGRLAELFASFGYVAIIQDVRGKYQSDGEFQPFINEEKDGFLTIEWASKQSFSSQKCAVVGFSYLGCCAWSTAIRQHPTVKTALPMFASQNCHSAWIDNGVPYLKDMLLWLYKNKERQEKEHSKEKIDACLKQLPVNKLDAIYDQEISIYREWMQHREHKEYWRTFGLSHCREEIHLPILFVGGWFDKLTDQIIEDFLMTAIHAPTHSLVKKSRLIIGPWGHYPMQRFEELKFGPQSEFFYQCTFFKKWFDLFLKDEPNDFDETNPIQYYIMGKNEWRLSSTWPPPTTKEKRYYLHSEGFANGGESGGHLQNSPGEREGKEMYIYNPLDPAPSIGSKMLYGDGYEGPKEQSTISARDDVLSFRSPTLEEDVTVAGHNKVILYVESTAKDTDFMVKLCDHFPDGRAYFLQSGSFRMHTLQENNHVRFLPNQVFCIEISLGSIAYAFLKGHKIQLQVTSSDFPHHSRNLNTGEDNEGYFKPQKAIQSIYHGKNYLSQLVLSTF